MSGGGGGKINSVFYADTYHPIQAGSIDGTDIASHDNAVYRALLCYNAHLYDPFGDPKVIGDPYCTVFVGRISHQTTEDTLRKAMSKYGKVKNLRLVRHIVTGASRGYAFVEYETEKEMHRAYEYAHHSIIDDSEIIVDYNRQQLMPGWIPRRLGGGLGGKKESGQLRFGGREKPFRAPLRPIPFDDLKRLGIPPPPEGRYMSRFQIPSPPRRKRSSIEWDGLSSDPEDRSYKHHGHKITHLREKSMSGDELSYERKSVDRHEAFQKHHKHRHSRQSELSISQDSSYDQRISVDGREHSHKHRERSVSQGHSHDERNPAGHKRHKHKQSRHHEKHERKHTSQDHSSDLKSYPNREEQRHKHQGRSSRNSHQHEVV